MTNKVKNQGDGNIVITGNVTGDGNVIGSVIHGSADRDPLARVEVNAHRTFIRPLGKLKAKHLGIIGGISFGTFALNTLSMIGSVASIYSVMYGTLPPDTVPFIHGVVMEVALIGTIPLILWAYFLRNKAVRLGMFGSVEVGRSGRLFLTNVRTDCPFCQGTMTMFSGAKGGPSPVLVCNRGGSGHRLWFDMTTLPDVEDEYEERREQQAGQRDR